LSGDPGDELGDSGVHGDPVEMNNGRVGLGGAVTVGPVERLLFVSLSPTAYLGGVEFA
jgi:hypothetical protein